jgi:basic amino acid/polyamine antiporter, APA family
VADQGPGERSPQIFTRKATGLTKDVGALDGFLFNLSEQNIGIGVTFLLLFGIAFYPGGNLWVALLMAALIALPPMTTYALLAAAMPRSGGDYVYIGRNLFPALGFVASFNAFIWIVVYVGLPATNLATYGLAELFRLVGHTTGTSSMVTLGSDFTQPLWQAAVGTLLIAAFAFMFIRGNRAYFRYQRWAISFAVVGVLLTIVLALTANAGDYTAHFNSYVQSIGGKANAAQEAISSARAAGIDVGGAVAFSFSETLKQTTWWLFIFLFAFLTTIIGGEVRQAKLSQILAVPGSVLAAVLLAGLLVFSVEHLVGAPLLQAIGAVDPAVMGLQTQPLYTELVAIAFPGLLVALVLGLAYMVWSYSSMPPDFLAASRYVLAWSFDGMVPSRASYVSPTRHTPVVAIVIVAVIAEIALILFVTGQLGWAVGVFGWMLTMILATISAVVFPFRRRELFEASGVNWRLGGIPVLSIIGFVSTITLAIALWVYWVDPYSGIGAIPQTQIYVVAIPLVGFIYYFGAKYIQARRGVHIERAFQEIPPE